MLVLLSATLNSTSEAGETSICDKIEYAFLNSPLQIFVDNFHFHYGETLDLGYGLEATTGISNGIAWYPSFLNFGKNFRMAIGDWHFNVIGAVYDVVKSVVNYSGSIDSLLKAVDCSGVKRFMNCDDTLWAPLYFNILRTLHLLSFEFFSFVKLKLISIGMIIRFLKDDDTLIVDGFVANVKNKCSKHKLADFYWGRYWVGDMNPIFCILAPMIHIDITKLITFFNEDEE